MADTDAEELDVPPPPYVETSSDEVLQDSYTNPLTVPAQRLQPSVNEYTPTEYNIEDTQRFYGS
jgi:hypothetical protein